MLYSMLYSNIEKFIKNSLNIFFKKVTNSTVRIAVPWLVFLLFQEGKTVSCVQYIVQHDLCGVGVLSWLIFHLCHIIMPCTT